MPPNRDLGALERRSFGSNGPGGRRYDVLHHSRLLLATLPLTLAAITATQSADAQTNAAASSTTEWAPAADIETDTAELVSCAEARPPLRLVE